MYIKIFLHNKISISTPSKFEISITIIYLVKPSWLSYTRALSTSIWIKVKALGNGDSWTSKLILGFPINMQIRKIEERRGEGINQTVITIIGEKGERILNVKGGEDL